jgi:Conjugal transfer protein
LIEESLARIHLMPTFEDKARLEAQLASVNSALKIHQVTASSIQHASETIEAQGQMLLTYSAGGIYEVETPTFHETALELQPGELLTGKDLPTAGDTARWTIAANRTGAPPNEITVLIVKPLEADLETNMTITTNRRGARGRPGAYAVTRGGLEVPMRGARRRGQWGRSAASGRCRTGTTDLAGAGRAQDARGRVTERSDLGTWRCTMG